MGQYDHGAVFGLVPGFDTAKLSYIANVTLYPTVLAVTAEQPWTTLEEFVADAKANPGQYTISNPARAGSGTCTRSTCPTSSGSS